MIPHRSLKNLLQAGLRPILLDQRTLVGIVRGIMARSANGRGGNQRPSHGGIELRPFFRRRPAGVTWKAPARRLALWT